MIDCIKQYKPFVIVCRFCTCSVRALVLLRFLPSVPFRSCRPAVHPSFVRAPKYRSASCLACGTGTFDILNFSLLSKRRYPPSLHLQYWDGGVRVRETLYHILVYIQSMTITTWYLRHPQQVTSPVVCH